LQSYTGAFLDEAGAYREAIGMQVENAEYSRKVTRPKES